MPYSAATDIHNGANVLRYIRVPVLEKYLSINTFLTDFKRQISHTFEFCPKFIKFSLSDFI